MLAWDTFKGAVFPYDEALCLSRVVGIDLEKDVINHLGVKDKGNIRFYTSQKRTEKGVLCLRTEQRHSMIDVFHLVAQTMRQAGLEMVSHKHEAFEQRIALLHQQLLEAGLEASKIDAIINQQKFSIENITQTTLPTKSE